MSSDGRYTPFVGRRVNLSPPMRVLHRFTKHGGHWAEIRERSVTTFRGIEFMVFMDGSLLDSEMFHGQRLAEYPSALAARIRQFVVGGWIEVPLKTDDTQ